MHCFRGWRCDALHNGNCSGTVKTVLLQWQHTRSGHRKQANGRTQWFASSGDVEGTKAFKSPELVKPQRKENNISIRIQKWRQSYLLLFFKKYLFYVCADF